MELLLSRGPFAVWIQGHPSASFSKNYKRVWSSCFSHTPQNYSIVKYLKAMSRNQRTLHLVDKQLPVDEACCQFGSYVKLLCTCRIEQQPSTSRSLSNAFTILMSNQAALSRRRLPDRIDARHKKDNLFNDLIRHVTNVGIMVQCKQCDMWRLLYSKRKLTLSEKQQLQSLFEDVSYSCGAMFEELNLPDTLSSVRILAWSQL